MTSRRTTPATALPDTGRRAGYPAADGVGKGLPYLLLAQEVHEFLCAEADLLDERRYEEWLDLLTDDISYWVPMRRNVQFGRWDTENTRQGRDMNWFDEGKATLRLRIKQITSGVHWVEEPSPRVSRMISNVHAIQATAEPRGPRGSQRQVPHPDLPEQARRQHRHLRRQTRGRAAQGGR